MSYATALMVDEGLGFIADTRVSAGIDDISTFRKLFTWEKEGEYCITILLSGNISTAQEIIQKCNEVFREGDLLDICNTMFQTAECVSGILIDSINRSSQSGKDRSVFSVSIILGGQIKGAPCRLFLIYPEGNFIEAQDESKFLSMGETKYGRAFVIANYSESLPENKVKILLTQAFEITSSSSLAVGLPADFHFYRSNTFKSGDLDRITSFDRNFSAMDQMRRIFSHDVANPVMNSENDDFFDLLRKLKEVTKKLSDLIRSINDPDIATSEVKAARAYIDSFQEFLDLNGANRPENIPGPVKESTLSSLRRVDWLKISEQANKWAKFIMDIIDKIR